MKFQLKSVQERLRLLGDINRLVTSVGNENMFFKAAPDSYIQEAVICNQLGFEAGVAKNLIS